MSLKHVGSVNRDGMKSPDVNIPVSPVFLVFPVSPVFLVSSVFTVFPASPVFTSDTWFVNVLSKLLVHVAQCLGCRQAHLTPFALLPADKMESGNSTNRDNGLGQGLTEEENKFWN